MPVYAPAPSFVDQRRHPRALLLIVGAHVALIGAMITAKMAVPIIQPDPPLIFRPIPIPPDPPPIPDPETGHQQVPNSDPYKPPNEIQVPVSPGPAIDTTPAPIPDPGPIAGTDPIPIPKPLTSVLRTGPRFMTPEWAIKPPYPVDKQRFEEEATLKLRLTIDERGRVIAVEPIGRADRSFLEAARKHLMAKWRYRPATENGRPVSSSTVITLRFELE